MKFDITTVPPTIATRVYDLTTWLEFNMISKYKVTDEGLEILQSARFHGIIGKMPVKITKVLGDFVISQTFINSLENCPDFIDGDFMANGTKIKDLSNFPKEIKGDVYLNNCKQLTDISGLTGNINNLSIFFSAIKNIYLPNIECINGDVNISNGDLSTATKGKNKVKIYGNANFSANLIANPSLFVDAFDCNSFDFSGNPCKANDEWETDCNW